MQKVVQILLSEMQIPEHFQFRLIGVGLYQLSEQQEESQLSLWWSTEIYDNWNNLSIFQANGLILTKYSPTLLKFRVIYFAQYIIHVSAELVEVTNTFTLLSCDWRDDQIRILQGAQNHMGKLPSHFQNSPLNFL